MPVECRGGIIVGVRQNGEDGGVRARNAGNSVEQKRGSKAAAAKLAVDGQPAEECRGNDTVARQTFGRFITPIRKMYGKNTDISKDGLGGPSQRLG